MHLGADMVGNETHDAFAVGGRQSLPSVSKALGQAIDPQTAIRVEHDLDNGWVFQPGGDRRSHRRAQHTDAARSRFRLGRNRPPPGPLSSPPLTTAQSPAPLKTPSP